MTPTEQLLGAAIATLSGVVGHLYFRIITGENRLMKKLDECEAKHEECEKDRASIWQRIASDRAAADKVFAITTGRNFSVGTAMKALTGPALACEQTVSYAEQGAAQRPEGSSSAPAFAYFG